MDCVAAGRRGAYATFDPYGGKLLWEPQTGHESYIEYEWNIYNPLGEHLYKVLEKAICKCKLVFKFKSLSLL